MTNDSIIAYVKHYMEKDICRGAIMLTGEWGVGKSYFIKHDLIPAIQDIGKDCVVVSLYGIKDLSEISKNIYFELRTKFLNTDSEVLNAGILAGKTVVRGITSFFGISLKASDDEMSKLYESIDLSNKLIVLEDLERSQIPIGEVLGYVNSLVDQDSVKVLLVANEEKYIVFENIEVEEDNPFSKEKQTKVIRRPTPDSAHYLGIKEKTVNDTIVFEGNVRNAIKDIIGMFKNETLNKFTVEKIDDIETIMYLCRCYNLRSFIYACQKTVDIYEQLPEEYLEDDSFMEAIFYGNVFFVLRIKNGKNLKWRDEKYYSIDLGNQTAPLFKFCYDYIVFQKLDLSGVEDACRALKDKNTYDAVKSNSDKDISVITNYHIHSEDEIKQAISNLSNRLTNPNDISFYMYGTIAVYLINIKCVLQDDVDITEIKRLLVENLRGRGGILDIDHIFRTVMGDNSDPIALQEYQLLRNEMSKALNDGIFEMPGFEYMPEQTNDFCDFVLKNEGSFHIKEGFARYLDVDRFAEMFDRCSLKGKDNIRGVFLSLYRSSNIVQFLAADYENLCRLKQVIEENRDKCNGDKIELMQYSFFISNLQYCIDKLER